MTIRNESGEYITITLGPLHSEAWVEYEIHVEAEVGFIKAGMETYAWASALRELFERLSKADRTVSGEIFIEQFSYEHDFDLRFTYDGLGHVEVVSTLRGHGEFYNRCTVSFATDQTFMATFLQEMQKELGI